MVELGSDDEWFEKHSTLEGEWTGPGQVVHLQYHQFYLRGPDRFEVDWTYGHDVVEVDALGSAVLTTINWSGPVAVHVELLDAPPGPADASWGAVEEAVLPVISDLYLMSMDSCFPVEHAVPPGDYEMRAHRRTWGAAYDEPTMRVREFFLIQLWPAASGDRVSRAIATRIETEARQAEEREQQEREERSARWEAEARRQMWGGREPSAALEAAGGQISAIAKVDWELAEAIANGSPDQQRAMAAWAVERASRGLDIPALDFAAAVDAIRNGRPVPPPFGDDAQAWELVFPGPSQLVLVASVGHGQVVEPFPSQIAPGAAALGAITATRDATPAAAAAGAFVQAWAGQVDRPAFWVDARQAAIDFGLLPPGADT